MRKTPFRATVRGKIFEELSLKPTHYREIAQRLVMRPALVLAALHALEGQGMATPLRKRYAGYWRRK